MADKDKVENIPQDSVEETNSQVAEEESGSIAGGGASIKAARFAPLGPSGVSATQNTMDLLLDVQLELSVELGRALIPVKEVLQLGPGSVVELNKLGGEPVDILVNGRPIARGEVVVVDENFGVRVTEIVNRGNGSVSID